MHAYFSFVVREGEKNKKKERRKKATKKKREKAFIIVEWMNEFNAKATNFEKKKTICYS
jgi:hypothetical protein